MVRPDPAPETPAERNARQQATLTRLAQIGMEIAEAAGRRAQEGALEGGFDPALAYSRAARAVRLTLALQSKLATEAQTRDKAEAARRRDRIHARVEKTIDTETLGDADGEQLSSDAWERLTEEDDADILARPIDEVVAQICRDLGLSAQWPQAFVEPDPAPPQPPSSPGLSGGPKPRRRVLNPRLCRPDEPDDDDPFRMTTGTLRPPSWPSGPP